MKIEIIIAAVICAAVCIGFSIYFGVTANVVMCIAFAVAAVLSFIPTVREVLRLRKNKKESFWGSPGFPRY